MIGNFFQVRENKLVFLGLVYPFCLCVFVANFCMFFRDPITPDKDN